jgi:hypothetical protein
MLAVLHWACRGAFAVYARWLMHSVTLRQAGAWQAATAVRCWAFSRSEPASAGAPCHRCKHFQHCRGSLSHTLAAFPCIATARSRPRHHEACCQCRQHRQQHRQQLHHPDAWCRRCPNAKRLCASSQNQSKSSALQFRVDVQSRSDFDTVTMSIVESKAEVPRPFRLTPLGAATYYLPRKPLDVKGLLFSPYGLLAGARYLPAILGRRCIPLDVNGLLVHVSPHGLLAGARRPLALALSTDACRSSCGLLCTSVGPGARCCARNARSRQQCFTHTCHARRRGCDCALCMLLHRLGLVTDISKPCVVKNANMPKHQTCVQSLAFSSSLWAPA